jgi:serine/threonine protein kinase
VQSLHFDFAELDTEPEVVILFKILSTFGPLPDALIKHVDDAKAGELLTDLWQAVKENDVFPNLTDEAKRLILRMTNLDPAKRATMSEIAKDSYWVEDEKSCVTVGVQC